MSKPIKELEINEVSIDKKDFVDTIVEYIVKMIKEEKAKAQ